MPALALLALASLMSGCDALPYDSDQIVTIQTAPEITGTSCNIANSVGSTIVYLVPNRISIPRDSRPLEIFCKSSMGYHGHAVVRTNTNILGITGMGNNKIAITSNAPWHEAPYQGNPTNIWNGTFNQYPSTIVVPMVPDVQ